MCEPVGGYIAIVCDACDARPAVTFPACADTKSALLENEMKNMKIK